MQTVSDEWKANQKSTTRSQGFVNIDIYAENENGGYDSTPTETISSLTKNTDTENKVEYSRLKQITHSSTYEPMGMNLPSNTCVIELYNYGDKYTDFWKKYNGDILKIVVTYGYNLPSGNSETISGGVFWCYKGISLDSDNVLSIEGISKLELLKDTVLEPFADLNTVEVLYNGKSSDTIVAENTSTTNYPTLTKNFSPKTCGDIINLVKEAGIPIEAISDSTESDSTDAISDSTDAISYPTEFYVTASDELTAGEAVQYVQNGLLKNVSISREDNVCFDDSEHTVSDSLLTLNMLQKPLYSQGTTVKSVSVVGQAASTSTEQVSYTSESSTTYSGKECTAGLILFDTSSYKLVEVFSAGEAFRIEGGGVYTENGETQTGIIVYNNYHGSITFKLYAVIQKMSEETLESETYSTKGEVCDITNPYIMPADTDKIANYYSNRDIYDLYMRADPAWDVGDYVYLSTSDDDDMTTYQLALILERELIFDGSFKANIKVRAIDTKFEDVTENSYASLSRSGKTYDELAAYTYNELNEGV